MPTAGKTEIEGQLCRRPGVWDQLLEGPTLYIYMFPLVDFHSAHQRGEQVEAYGAVYIHVSALKVCLWTVWPPLYIYICSMYIYIYMWCKHVLCMLAGNTFSASLLVGPGDMDLQQLHLLGCSFLEISAGEMTFLKSRLHSDFLLHNRNVFLTDF